MIDANVSIGHYPFRKLPFDSQDPSVVKTLLQKCGIRRVCVSSLHAIFYGDPHQGNQELLPQVANDDFYLAVGVVDPSLQNWRETLVRCIEDYGCRMIKLYPSYHQYRIRDRIVEDLLEAASAHNIVVAIVQRIEDERMHHRLMPVAANELPDLMGTAQRFRAPLVVLGAYHAEIRQIARMAPNVYFDISFAETMNTMASLTEDVAPQRLLLGTHTPLLYAEAAIGKVELWDTSEANHALVTKTNLAQLLSI